YSPRRLTIGKLRCKCTGGGASMNVLTSFGVSVTFALLLGTVGPERRVATRLEMFGSCAIKLVLKISHLYRDRSGCSLPAWRRMAPYGSSTFTAGPRRHSFPPRHP